MQQPRSSKDLLISEEIKQEVINISQDLGLSKEYQTKLKQTTSFQQLLEVQTQSFKEKLLEKENSLNRIEKNTKQLKVGLSILIILVIMLVTAMVSYYIKNQSAETKRLKKD